MAKKQTEVRKALLSARRLLRRWREIEITSNAMIERECRPRSVQDGNFFFNADTVKDVDALRSIKAHDRALVQIQKALV